MTAGEKTPRARGAGSVLAVIFITTLMMSAGTNMLNIAVPAVATDFNASALASTLLLLAYPLFNTMFIIPAGQAADIIDRRFVFLGGVAAYALLNIVLGFSPTIELLSIGRAVQGIAAAMLLSSAVSILILAFPPHKLATAMGVYLAGFSLGQVSGPMLGGLIATALGWQWVFWAAAPVALVALGWGLFALRGLPVPRREPGRKRTLIDLPGAFLLAIILGAAQIVLGLGGTLGFAHLVVLGLLATAIILVPILLRAERRVRRPVLDPDLFARPEFPKALLQGFLVMLPRLGAVTAAGLYFQGMLGDSAAIAAIKTATFPIMLTVGSLIGARVRAALGERSTIILSASVAAAGMATLVISAFTGSELLIIIGLGVLGLGNGVFQTLNASAITTSAPAEKAGLVNAIRTTTQTFGTGAGLAIAMSLSLLLVSAADGAAFLAGTPTGVSQGGRLAIDQGFVLTYSALLVLMLLGLALSWYRRRR